MLRAVADANVLVSAALARSPQAPSVLTLDAALDGRVELVTSPLLLEGGHDLCSRDRACGSTCRPTRRCASWRTWPHKPTWWSTRLALIQRCAAIPDDDYLIELAQVGGARMIISGDLDLLAIDPGQLAVEILTPRQFAAGWASLLLGTSEVHA